ncbi:inverse autotransporter beta domain-containing protein [Vibrio crassostreae]|nr:inverse autotransporter beta domain-containing protein [Vibrio crassostreae]TCU06672.1 inverse autotransporter-like protein with beta domain [Vibrio crassostreae]
MIAGELINAAQALNNGAPSNYTENAISRAQDYANQQLENSVTAWLAPYATVDFTTNLLQNFKAPSASLNALVPFYDFESQLLFTQFGYQLNDDDTFLGRKFFNVGLGARYSTDEYIVGLNGFFDHDITRSHQRASVGFEGFADYFKLTSNYYFPLSAWKDSPDFEMHQERVAKGFEVNVEGYLPSYSHLGASFTYEQYFGDEVDILGTKDKQSDPYAGALSVEYTPVPMISINSGITKAKGQDFRVNAGIDLTYRLGVPWDKQVSPASVDITRQLDGQRYDLVSRNNNIVLEYREKTTLTVSLKSQSILTLNAGDDYQPLILSVVINGEKATAIPVTQAQSGQSDLRTVSAPTDYQISWTLPPALLAPSTLNNLQAFEILPPPIPGNYEYQAIVTQKSSGKSQTVTGVLTVELDNALTEVHWTPTSLINISKSSASFEITKVVNSPKLRSALKRYLDQAGATLTPRLMQHTNILNIDWAAPNITLSTKEGQTLSSLLTLEGEPVIALVYLLGFGEIVVPIILTDSNLYSSPLNIGSDVTATFGEANFTQEATGGNGGAVTYRSGNENVATVEANGEVTLVGVGSAVITATEAASANFAGQTATYTVTVTPATSGDAGFSPLNIGSDVTATFGEANFTQEATGGNGGAVTYRSGNENVATVEANGEVTLVGVGSAVITATEAASANFAGQTATYTVTVNYATVSARGQTWLPALPAEVYSSLGVTYDAEYSEDGRSIGQFTQYKAESICSNIVINGQNNWRLPNAIELRRLYAEKGNMSVYGWPTDRLYYASRYIPFHQATIINLSNGLDLQTRQLHKPAYVACVFGDF